MAVAIISMIAGSNFDRSKGIIHKIYKRSIHFWIGRFFMNLDLYYFCFKMSVFLRMNLYELGPSRSRQEAKQKASYRDGHPVRLSSDSVDRRGVIRCIPFFARRNKGMSLLPLVFAPAGRRALVPAARREN